MNTSRLAAWLRADLKSLVGAALVLMLLFSAFASASPSLHHWVHADDKTPTHCCLVTTLEHGHTEVASTWAVISLPVSEMNSAARWCESFFVSHDTKLFPERGPPSLP